MLILAMDLLIRSEMIDPAKPTTKAKTKSDVMFRLFPAIWPKLIPVRRLTTLSTMPSITTMAMLVRIRSAIRFIVKKEIPQIKAPGDTPETPVVLITRGQRPALTGHLPYRLMPLSVTAGQPCKVFTGAFLLTNCVSARTKVYRCAQPFFRRNSSTKGRRSFPRMAGSVSAQLTSLLPAVRFL